MKFKLFYSILIMILIGFILPDKTIIPVIGATRADWHPQSFWFEPWGRSGVHKGIDIFAKKGTPLISSTYGWVLFSGELSQGGNVILVLGPKWRLHYYAHLDAISADLFTMLIPGEKMGTVGDTGNAKGKPAHVHYAIIRLIPHPWDITLESQGWKKMFFVDPGQFLTSS